MSLTSDTRPKDNNVTKIIYLEVLLNKKEFPYFRKIKKIIIIKKIEIYTCFFYILIGRNRSRITPALNNKSKENCLLNLYNKFIIT